jgi:hypothetical protein
VAGHEETQGDVIIALLGRNISNAPGHPPALREKLSVRHTESERWRKNQKSPAPPLPRESDDYVPGELASVEEPDINFERIQQLWESGDAERFWKKRNPKIWEKVEEIRKRQGK